jgi:DNA-binding XRE family transcriptional regulator
MSITAKIAERKQQEDKRHDAFNVAAAIVQLDPHAREDLITYMKAFNEAQTAGDEQEQEYLVKAILEVFEVNPDEDGPDLETWEEEIRSSGKGREAAKALQDETDRFFKAYQQYKARCSLTTVRAIAEAAGLSPTTVQAIEKQSVKPQFKTIRALAKAFGVPPEALNGK